MQAGAHQRGSYLLRTRTQTSEGTNGLGGIAGDR
jgi:hypothetical protein